MQFMESNSETCNMALENIVTGAKHFELSKTDVGEPRYAFFCKQPRFFFKAAGKADGRKGLQLSQARIGLCLVSVCWS